MARQPEVPNLMTASILFSRVTEVGCRLFDFCLERSFLFTSRSEARDPYDLQSIANLVRAGSWPIAVHRGPSPCSGCLNQPFCSCASSLFLRSMPQRYPPRPPFLRTTRWQGTTSATGLVAQARATARV